MEAPIDLTQAIENPDLVRALERLASEASEKAQDEVLPLLQRATFLVAILDESLETFDENPEQIVFDPGRPIEVLIAETDDGLAFLPLFTDWQAIADYTEDKVKGIVMPAREAWAFALHDEVYEGAVINPSGDALPLGRPMLEFLLAAGSATEDPSGEG